MQPYGNRPEWTGRFLVTMEDTDHDPAAVIRALHDASGIQVASSADYGPDVVATQAFADQADAVYLNDLGVAVVNPSEDRASRLQRAAAVQPKVMSIEQEVMMYALGGIFSEDYVRGFRDGVSSLAQATLAVDVQDADPSWVRPAFDDSETATWGIQAVGASGSRYTGSGVKVAVLDTGFDLLHPDFDGRDIVSRSFIAGEPVQDGNGHGTHCAGTACGPVGTADHPRYGVAPDANLYVGKVLSDRGSGASGGVIEGIGWAITEGCTIISMSLGSPTFVGQPISVAYERAAQRALAQGSLIVAAAGNESNRPYRIAPLGSPGNCPSVFTVAAIDQGLRVATFSSGGTDPNAGALEIAAPGVNVFSSSPMPQRYRRLAGTSMATPHVAGVAALYAESDPALRGDRLWRRLEQTARSLEQPVRDVGNGLTQAA